MKIFLFISVFFVGIIYSYGKHTVLSADKEKAIRLLVYDERIVTALRLFTTEVKNSGRQKNTYETADNIYWIAECLFQLKKTGHLETVLKKGESFTIRHNLDAYAKLKTTEGKYLIEKGKYDDCILLLTPLAKQVKDNTILCEIQLTLADANQRKQSLENSLTHYQYVINHSTNTIQTARAYNGLGSYYCMLSNLDAAKICYDTAYNQFYRHLGAQHSRTAQVQYNLGLIADRNFDLFAAEQHFTKALTIYQKRLGDLHPRTAEAYGTLGSLLLMKDNPQKALYYSLKERDILLQLYGKDNPDLAYSYLNCGKIYYLLNEQKESAEELKLAIDLVIKSFGKQHNLFSQCIVELSKIYTDQKRYDDAAKILSEVIDLKRNNADDYLADIYQQAGENYLQLQQYEKAFLQFKKANDLYVDYFGNKNSYSIEPLTGMSDVFLKQGKYQEAYRMAEAAWL